MFDLALQNKKRIPFSTIHLLLFYLFSSPFLHFALFIHLYKNIVFMPRLNIIIFLPILSWNWIFLWILLNYNVWHFRFIDFDQGVEVQFWSQTASDEGLIWHKQLLAELLSASVKQASCAECVVLWLVCRLEKGGIDTMFFYIYFESKFPTHKIYSSKTDCRQKIPRVGILLASNIRQNYNLFKFSSSCYS